MRRLLPIFAPLQSSAELAKLQAAFHWRGLPAILPEYFHGDNGAGIGASH